MLRKKYFKRLGAALLTGIVLLQSNGISTAIASERISYNLNGSKCTGFVEYVYESSGTCDGVRATTTFSNVNADTVRVKATVRYKVNGVYKTISKESSGSYGASIVAYTNGSGTVVGGKGTHYVKCKAGTWGPDYTLIGSWN